MSSFCMNQLNFIHQRSVTPLLPSDSKYSKRTILAHSVACSRTPSYSNNCACSEGVHRVCTRYCDNHAQKMQKRARLIQEAINLDSIKVQYWLLACAIDYAIYANSILFKNHAISINSNYRDLKMLLC